MPQGTKHAERNLRSVQGRSQQGVCRSSRLNCPWLLTSFSPRCLGVTVAGYFRPFPRAEASCWLGRGAGNAELHSVSITVTIVNHTLGTQSAPGAVSTTRSTATVFRELCGSFPGPSALIRSSCLPPFLHSSDLSCSLSCYRGAQQRHVFCLP